MRARILNFPQKQSAFFDVVTGNGSQVAATSGQNDDAKIVGERPEDHRAELLDMIESLAVILDNISTIRACLPLGGPREHFDAGKKAIEDQLRDARSAAQNL